MHGHSRVQLHSLRAGHVGALALIVLAGFGCSSGEREHDESVVDEATQDVKNIDGKNVFRYAGHTYKVFVKNENIVSWLDGKPDVMSPDLICNLDPKTGDTVFGQGLGAYPAEGENAMIAIPASPLWRTPRGVEVLGPRHFGFDFDYIPLEELQKKRATLAHR